MPSNHMLEEAFDLNGEYLSGASDQYAKLHVVWGMQGLDERDYNKYDPPCSCTKKTLFIYYSDVARRPFCFGALSD